MRKILLTLKLIFPINEMTESPHLKLEQYQEEWVDSLDGDDNFFGPLLSLQYEACF